MPRLLESLPCAPDPSALDALLPRLAATLDGTGPALLPVPTDDPAARARVVAALVPDDPDRPVHDDVAVVVATSGSTGEPKGVLLSADALSTSARATLDALGGPGQWLICLPVTHIAGLQVLVRSLAAGIAPVPLDAREGFVPHAFAAATAELRGRRRYTALVPTQLVRLLDAGGDAVEAAASYDAVLLGGAAGPRPLLARARAAGIRIVTTYGMSETSGGCVYDGQPLPGVTVDVDATGRIHLGGAVLGRGYRLRPDLTAASFVDGRFRTGDLGRFDAGGRLVVIGRVDDVVVSGGEKVAVGAVEEALAEHPQVREVAVVGVADSEWGQRVEAVVVPVDGLDPPSLADLRAHVAARLGRVAAPRTLRVVAALPLLPSGKVDRAALASLPGTST